MNHRLATAVILSTVIHIVLYLWSTQKSERGEAAPVTFIEFTSSSIPQATPTPKRAGKKARAKTPVGAPIRGGLQKALRTDFSEWATQSQNTAENWGTDNPSDGMAVDLNRKLVQDRHLPKIWRQIRSQLGYRPEHVRERVHGHVTMSVQLDKNGQLLRVHADSAQGPRDLQGWVILCLVEALKKPYLTEPLPGPLQLELSVLFTLEDGSMDHWRPEATDMTFVVRGSTPVHQALVEGIHDLVADEKLKNHREWSFFDKVNSYAEVCERQANTIACGKAADLYETIGHAERARYFRERHR